MQRDLVFDRCHIRLGGNGSLPPVNGAVSGVITGESSGHRPGCPLPHPERALGIASVGSVIDKTFVDSELIAHLHPEIDVGGGGGGRALAHHGLRRNVIVRRRIVINPGGGFLQVAAAQTASIEDIRKREVRGRGSRG